MLNMAVWMPILFLVLFIGIFAVAFGPVVKTAIKGSQLKKNGISAQAVVQDIQSTNVYINNQPRVRLNLQVMPVNQPPFFSEAYLTMSYFSAGMYAPGSLVEVRYNPADTSQVAIIGRIGVQPQMGMGNVNQILQGLVSSGMIAPMQVNVDLNQSTSLEDTIRGIDSFNKSLQFSGVLADGSIISANDLGMRVNGNNPVMQYWVRVTPEGRPPFQAEAKAIVAESSLAKYQPGALVKVKFDPNEMSRVTLVPAES